MGFERKLKKVAYFIFKMTGPTGQFGLLVSALSYAIIPIQRGILLANFFTQSYANPHYIVGDYYPKENSIEMSDADK